VQLLDFDDAVLRLPADVQKADSTDNSPSYTRIGLADGTVRTLRTYLATQWKDTDALFPSRQSDRMTTESVRDVVRGAVITADINTVVSNGRADEKRCPGAGPGSMTVRVKVDAAPGRGRTGFDGRVIHAEGCQHVVHLARDPVLVGK